MRHGQVPSGQASNHMKVQMVQGCSLGLDANQPGPDLRIINLFEAYLLKASMLVNQESFHRLFYESRSFLVKAGMISNKSPTIP